MLDMLRRHGVQVMREAGSTQGEVAKRTGICERTVRRIEQEPAVTAAPQPSPKRPVGRPSKAEPFRPQRSPLLRSPARSGPWAGLPRPSPSGLSSSGC